MVVPAHLSNRWQKIREQFYQRNFMSAKFDKNASAKLEILYDGNFLEITCYQILGNYMLEIS